MLLECSGGLNQHTLSGSPKTLKIPPKILKVHNELGKFTEFGTSRHLFSWRNGRSRKVWADSAPPTLIGLNSKEEILFLYHRINLFYFRRTDYIKLRQRQNREFFNETFYLHAMDYCRSKHKSLIFLILSDDPKWCGWGCSD